MARLPVDLLTLSNRDSLPSAQVSVQQADAGDFGGQIGQALGGLAQVGSQLAAKIKVNQDRVRDFGYEQQFTQLQEQDGIEYEQRVRGLSGSADGHWQASREQTNKRFDEWVKTLPEQARAEYSARAQKFQAARTAQAFQDQFKQQDTNTRQVLTEEQRKAGLAVQQTPQSYEQFVASQEILIDKSTLTPAEKEAQKQQVRNSLAFIAEQARATQNPAEVVAQTTGGTFRAKIRSKESGNSDTVRNPNSSAVGRYQFLEGTWNRFAGAAGLPLVTDENRYTKNDPRKNGEWSEKALDGYIAASVAQLKADQLPVNDANLYLLHFMGQAGGAKFLRAQRADPSASAAAAFPAEAAANKAVFYTRDGGAKSVGEVYAQLTKGLAQTSTPNAQNQSAASGQLTPAQSAQVTETAQNELNRQLAASEAEAKAAAQAQRNQLYIDLKEGPAPEVAYDQARRSGVLSSFEDIDRAEGIIEKRNKGDADYRVGLALIDSEQANPFNKDHKDGVAAVYERGVAQGQSGAALAADLFDRTGIVPPQFATSIRGALVSQKPDEFQAGLVTASGMMRKNPNAFAGVEGGSDLEKQAFEFSRLTEGLGMSAGEAAQRMMKDARDPERLKPVKQEQEQQFKKDHLTQAKIEARVQQDFATGVFGGGAPEIPQGPQRVALASIYSEFAVEGFRQFGDPDKALEFAKLRVSQQFGAQNGVLTRYPPSKTLLPPLSAGPDPYAWINEQAADIVKRELGVIVKPSQIVFMPVERAGASTRAAFDGRPQTVNRQDSKPGQTTSYQSVPYAIQVIPDTAEGDILTVDGVFFPDAETYVNEKNAQPDAAPLTGYDRRGMPFTVPARQREFLKTPEQQQLAKDAELRRSQAEERAAQQELGDFMAQQKKRAQASYNEGTAQ